MTRGLRVVESTWWLPRHAIPPTPSKLLDATASVDRRFLPQRFGPGDPPRSVEGRFPQGFASYWEEKIEQGVGIIRWLGRPPSLNWSMYFGPDDGHPRSVARLRAYAEADGLAPTATADLLSAVADALGCVYACAFVLKGWVLRRRVLLAAAGQSEESHLPAGTRWLGLPAEVPWLSWVGGAYAELLAGIGVHPDGRRIIGAADAYPAEAGSGAHPAFPMDLVAKRPDDRFAAVAPSVEAVTLPPLAQPFDVAT